MGRRILLFGVSSRRKEPPVEPRIITSSSLHTCDTRIGDLLEIVGGYPSVPGDECELIGGVKTVVCQYRGTLYYRIVS